jgi:hypothetical protein
MTDYVALAQAALARYRAQQAAAAATTECEKSEISEKRVPDAEAQTPDADPQALRRAALLFVNKAGARLVRNCQLCYPEAPADAPYLVLVPTENDGPEFRRALATLGLPHPPVVPRRAPLSYLPVRCEHVEPGPGSSEGGRGGGGP